SKKRESTSTVVKENKVDDPPVATPQKKINRGSPLPSSMKSALFKSGPVVSKKVPSIP
ncbi:hypothetical protein KI387_005665, partial [Taxus chinensis]